MITEDALILLLTRIETLAARADRAEREERRLERERDDLRSRLLVAQEGNRRRDRDMKAAEAKVCEWAEYASQLRSAITAVAPNAVRKKTIVLPDMPAPLETEIPF